jgi:hypothetical protein
MNSPQGPDWVVDQVRQICLSELENARLRGDEFKLSANTFVPMLRDVRVSHGKDSRKAKWKEKWVTFYAACCLVTTSIAAVFANQGSVWLKQNWNQAYKGEPLGISGDYPVSLSGLGANPIVAAFLQLQGSNSENQDANDREIDATPEEKVLRQVELNP